MNILRTRMQNLSLQNQKNIAIRCQNIHVVHVRCVQHEKELYLTSYNTTPLQKQSYKYKGSTFEHTDNCCYNNVENKATRQQKINKQQKNIPRTRMQNLSLQQKKNIAIRHWYIHAVHVRCVQNKKNYILCRQNLSVYWMSAIVILFPLSSASTTTSGSSASTTDSASSSGSR